MMKNVYLMLNVHKNKIGFHVQPWRVYEPDLLGVKSLITEPYESLQSLSISPSGHQMVAAVSPTTIWWSVIQRKLFSAGLPFGHRPQLHTRRGLSREGRDIQYRAASTFWFALI